MIYSLFTKLWWKSKPASSLRWVSFWWELRGAFQSCQLVGVGVHMGLLEGLKKGLAVSPLSCGCLLKSSRHPGPVTLSQPGRWWRRGSRLRFLVPTLPSVTFSCSCCCCISFHIHPVVCRAVMGSLVWQGGTGSHLNGQLLWVKPGVPFSIVSVNTEEERER